MKFCLTLSVMEKSKSSIFYMSKVSETLKISNLRTTIAKSFNLHTIRKLIDYKKCSVKAMITLEVFEILLSKGRLALSPTQWGTGSRTVKVLVEIQKTIRHLFTLTFFEIFLS